MILEILTFAAIQAIGVVHNPPGLQESLRCAGYWNATLEMARDQLPAEDHATLSDAYDDIKSTLLVIITSRLDPADWSPALDDAKAAARSEARRATASETGQLSLLRSRADACRAAVMADRPR